MIRLQRTRFGLVLDLGQPDRPTRPRRSEPITDLAAAIKAAQPVHTSCSHPDCAAVMVYRPASGTSPEQARILQGWVFEGDSWFCSDHARVGEPLSFARPAKPAPASSSGFGSDGEAA